jgi:hypothetical protein
LLAIALYFLFAWLDPLILPDVQDKIMVIRIVSCLFFVSVIALTCTRWGQLHFQFLMSMVVLFAGLGIMGMIVLAESTGVNTLYPALILTIMYAHALLKIRFGYASLTTWFLVFLYMIVSLTLGTIPFEFYMNNIFFLISANMMGMFASYWLENNPDGTFTAHRLPNLAQVSPINDIVITDVDGDGSPDLIVAGNLYHSEPTAPRADAGNGLWLKGNGQGAFTPIGPTRSGLLASKDVKSLKLVQTPGGQMLLVGNNNEPVQVFNIQQ